MDVCYPEYVLFTQSIRVNFAILGDKQKVVKICKKHFRYFLILFINIFSRFCPLKVRFLTQFLVF